MQIQVMQHKFTRERGGACAGLEVCLICILILSGFLDEVKHCLLYLLIFNRRTTKKKDFRETFSSVNDSSKCCSVSFLIKAVTKQVVCV